jgi:hypothetical protein
MSEDRPTRERATPAAVAPEPPEGEEGEEAR